MLTGEIRTQVDRIWDAFWTMTMPVERLYEALGEDERGRLLELLADIHIRAG
jgi:hypothetical protein